jgi:hypothetical protein
VTNDAGETDTTTETVTVDDADGTGDADDADGTGDTDDADGTGDADDADGEPAGFGVTAVLALLVLALVAAAAVFWIRQDE